MIPIKYFMVPILLSTIYLIFIVLENYWYYKEQRKKEIIYKKAKEAENKKKPKEFKWPENLPHFDL